MGAGCGAGADDETVGVCSTGVGVDGLMGVEGAGRAYHKYSNRMERPS